MHSCPFPFGLPCPTAACHLFHLEFRHLCLTVQCFFSAFSPLARLFVCELPSLLFGSGLMEAHPWSISPDNMRSPLQWRLRLAPVTPHYFPSNLRGCPFIVRVPVIAGNLLRIPGYFAYLTPHGFLLSSMSEKTPVPSCEPLPPIGPDSVSSPPSILPQPLLLCRTSSTPISLTFVLRPLRSSFSSS